MHDGKHYDSKAIVGAAHGFQFDRPLTRDAFSGGEQTVAAKLESLGFQVQRPSAKGAASEEPDSPAARHPTWNRDELIIALAAYVRWEGNPPGKTSADIMALSQFLNGLRISLGTPAHETLRNANGVYMKLMNFRRFDQAYSSQGKSGLTRGGKLEAEIWDTFHPHPERLARIADAIRSGMPAAGQIAPDIAAEQLDRRGGGFRRSRRGPDPLGPSSFAANARRNSRRPRRTKPIRHLANSAAKSVSSISMRPMASGAKASSSAITYSHSKASRASQKTRLDDLALVCANCHRMIHARRPWLSLKALRAIRPCPLRKS